MSVPPRTTASLVEGVLVNNWDGVTDLTPFITAATTIVDQVAAGTTVAHANTPVTLSDAQLEVIETWLAAHFYRVNDPAYMSKSTGRASGSFQHGSAGQGFDTTDYGRMAIMLDTSGVLASLNKRAVAGVLWLGKHPSEQIPYTQRS